jgi:hypothetical protein
MTMPAPTIHQRAGSSRLRRRSASASSAIVKANNTAAPTTSTQVTSASVAACRLAGVRSQFIQWRSVIRATVG